MQSQKLTVVLSALTPHLRNVLCGWVGSNQQLGWCWVSFLPSLSSVGKAFDKIMCQHLQGAIAKLVGLSLWFAILEKRLLYFMNNSAHFQKPALSFWFSERCWRCLVISPLTFCSRPLASLPTLVFLFHYLSSLSTVFFAIPFLPWKFRISQPNNTALVTKPCVNQMHMHNTICCRNLVSEAALHLAAKFPVKLCGSQWLAVTRSSVIHWLFKEKLLSIF